MAAHDKIAGLLDQEKCKSGEISFRDLILGVLKKSRIKDIIEFSRAVHAEMDAIVSVARNANGSLVDAVLYCTTYPCHNCAKHIVAAGIKRVVYVEPYDKSLATELHADSISDSGFADGQTVSFELYNGVSPRRYDDFFKKRNDRKIEGKYNDRSKIKDELLPYNCSFTDELLSRLKEFEVMD